MVDAAPFVVLRHFLIGVRRLDSDDGESFRISKGKTSKQNNLKSIKVPPSTA